MAGARPKLAQEKNGFTIASGVYTVYFMADKIKPANAGTIGNSTTFRLQGKRSHDAGTTGLHHHRRQPCRRPTGHQSAQGWLGRPHGRDRRRNPAALSPPAAVEGAADEGKDARPDRDFQSHRV